MRLTRNDAAPAVVLSWSSSIASSKMSASDAPTNVAFPPSPTHFNSFQQRLVVAQIQHRFCHSRRVNVRWKPLSASNDMEHKSSLCLRMQQISVRPSVAPSSDVPKVVQSLLQLTKSIQKQHSIHLRSFVEGESQSVGHTDQDDKLQAMLTLKKRKNVEINLVI